jgi:hypothetical protein
MRWHEWQGSSPNVSASQTPGYSAKQKPRWGYNPCDMGSGPRGGWAWGLDHNRPPADVPRHRWRQIVDACQAFIASEQLASRAAELGWSAMALFGCRPNYPLSYLGKAGLLWHVNGGKIIELHRTWAVIDGPVNRSLRIFYRRNIAPEQITLPWMLDLPPLVRTG